MDLTFEGKFAVLTLNNVPKKNAVTYERCDSLRIGKR